MKNGRRPQKKMEDDLKKIKNEDNLFLFIFLNGKRLKKMEDEPINLIGCDTIVNSPSHYLTLMNNCVR